MRSGSGLGGHKAVLAIVALSVAGCGETEQRGSPSAGAPSAGGDAGAESRAGGTSSVAGSSSNLGGAASAGASGSVAGGIDPGFRSDYPTPPDFGPPPALALH